MGAVCNISASAAVAAGAESLRGARHLECFLDEACWSDVRDVSVEVDR